MENFANAIQEFVNNALGVSIIEMLIQIASTLLLFVVVRLFFWEHITNYLEKRKEQMSQDYDEAKQAKQNAEEKKQKAEEELKEIRLSAKERYEKAKSRGEKEAKDIIENAKQEAENILSNAQKEIRSEIEKARKNINDEIVSVATLMTKKIIDKKLTKKEHEQLLDDINESVIS